MSDRIEEIRKRWGAATPGPWDVITSSGRGEEKWRTIRAKGRPVVRVDEFTRYTRGEPETFCGVWIADANAGAIGAAPSDIAFLLAEVERLNDACRQYEQAMLAAREKLTELRQQMADSEEG